MSRFPAHMARILTALSLLVLAGCANKPDPRKTTQMLVQGPSQIVFSNTKKPAEIRPAAHLQRARVAKLDDHEKRCAVDVVKGEADGESDVGKAVVMQTLLNRTTATGKELCRIAYQSYTPRLAKQEDVLRLSPIVENFQNQVPPRFLTATHFYSGKDRPDWAKDEYYLGQIGGHRFYALPQTPTLL